MQAFLVLGHPHHYIKTRGVFGTDIAVVAICSMGVCHLGTLMAKAGFYELLKVYLAKGLIALEEIVMPRESNCAQSPPLYVLLLLFPSRFPCVCISFSPAGMMAIYPRDQDAQPSCRIVGAIEATGG